MLLLSSINKKKIVLLILFLVFLILIIYSSIYYLDQKSSKSINYIMTLKEYESFKKSSILLGQDNEISSSNYYLRTLRKMNSLTDKKLSEKDKYIMLTQINAFIFALYSDTNNHKLYNFQKELRIFTKFNFPKFYNEKKDFFMTCVDSSCAETPQPPEILDLIKDIESSKLSEKDKIYLKSRLLNIGYMPKNAIKSRAVSYIIMVGSINDAFNPTSPNTSNDISEKLKKYIKENYPAEFKKAYEEQISNDSDPAILENEKIRK